MQVLMISNDRRIADASSGQAKRIAEYGGLIEKLWVFVLGHEGRQINLSQNVSVIPISSKLMAPFVAIRQTKRLNETGKFDLVTAQDPFWAGLVGVLIKKIFGYKLQIQIHADVLSPYFRGESLLNFLRYLLAVWLIPKSDGLRVVSERIKRSIIEKFPHYPADNITVLPIFIENTTQNEIKNLRSRFGEYVFTILMASRFSKEKNITLAIKAMAEIVKAYPRTLLLIVGDGPMKGLYQNYINQLDLSDNVKIEPWADYMLSYYAAADLFLLTSNYEGYGRTLVEAAMAGCQIISSDVGIADTLLEKSNIFRVNDFQDLIVKMILAIEGKTKPSKPILPTGKREYLRHYLKAWEMCL